MNSQPEPHELESLREEIILLMKQEIAIMRDILSSMQEEQEALLHNDTVRLKKVMEKQAPLVDQMMPIRQQRLERLKIVAESKGFPVENVEEVSIETQQELTTSSIWECIGPEWVSVLSLRDQLVALLEALRDQAQKNNYLIQNKVSLTRQVVERLQEGSDSATYKLDGTYQKKAQTTTVTLINKEG